MGLHTTAESCSGVDDTSATLACDAVNPVRLVSGGVQRRLLEEA
jgi:hypothetical protein